MSPEKAQQSDNPTIDFDTVSRIYDKVRAGSPEMIHQILIGFNAGPESIVLDLGCGTGSNTVLFKLASKAQVIGIDLSRGMLEHAAEKAESIEFVNCPADRLPFGAGQFDLVFMTEVIHHLPEVPPVLLEAYRILNSGGLLCVVTQSHQQIEGRMTSKFFPATTEVDKARYPDIDEIEAMMKNAGFENAWHSARDFEPETLGDDYLETVSERGYSMLHKISEADYHHGLGRLKEAYDRKERLIYTPGYTFVWAVKQ